MNSRINKYRDDICKFIKKCYIPNISKPTQNLVLDMIESDEHYASILCLTIHNNQCKKNNIQTHGYYLSSGIDCLSIIAKIMSHRDYYNQKYENNIVENAIIEIVNSFYSCIAQNINTLCLSKNGNINIKIYQLCIDYATKYIPLITYRTTYASSDKMKKTDLFCMDINDEQYQSYKKMNRLSESTLTEDTQRRYGSVCKLALGLGWFLGQNHNDAMIVKMKDLSSDKTIEKLEALGDNMGRFFKLHDDFRYITQDIQSGKFSCNFVINYGIKFAYNEIVELKALLLEHSIKLGVDTKTSKEIIDIVVKDVDNIVKDVSVDMLTQYDDVSDL